MLIVIIDKLDT